MACHFCCSVFVCRAVSVCCLGRRYRKDEDSTSCLRQLLRALAYAASCERAFLGGAKLLALSREWGRKRRTREVCALFSLHGATDPADYGAKGLSFFVRAVVEKNAFSASRQEVATVCVCARLAARVRDERVPAARLAAAAAVGGSSAGWQVIKNETEGGAVCG
jgi:hypothetical protein